MVMDSACKLRVGSDQYDGEVRMEGDHIDFAGATKFRFRLGEIRNPRREADAILFSFHGNPVSIKLDGAGTVERWMDYILHPQSLADRLGVQEGQTVRVMNLDDSALLSSLETKSAKVLSQRVNPCDMVLLGVERSSELTQIGDLSETLRSDGAIWVVLPKTGRTVTKAAVFAAVRQAGLRHTEVVDYSETQAAYKIVRPPVPGSRSGSSDGGSQRRTAPAAQRASRRAAVKAK